MTEQEMRQFVKDYVKAINSHDNKYIEEFHDPKSASVSAGDPGHTMDRAGRRRYFQEREKAFPDAKMSARNIQVDPKGGTVTFDWTIRATHKGTFKGMAPTNKPVSNRGTTVLTLRNGKITREESRQDVAMFMKQVSAGGPSAKR
ncbi:MAG TPA: ester cyclase [Blastocatellia bacterium]|jgi:steroid delta-isomerase-like uncharacterized protein